MSELFASDKVDILSIEAEDIEVSLPLHVPDYEELIEVVTRVVARLNISLTTSGFPFSTDRKSYNKPHCVFL